jgi:hypothetical protein
MSWHPIILSGAEVRVVLDGSKVQIWRPVNMRWIDYVGPKGCADDPGSWGWADDYGEYHLLERGLPGRGEYSIHPPLGDKGGKLWVRETWCCKINPSGYESRQDYYYRADGEDVVAYDEDCGFKYRKDGTEASPWISPARMPRIASRISLEIVADVQVERVDGRWFWVYEVKRIDDGAKR